MRLIDANDLHNRIYSKWNITVPIIPEHAGGLSEALDYIEKQPIIDPVHAAGACYCKECEYWIPEDGTSTAIMSCANGFGCPKENDFCSRGEKRR